MGLSEIMGMTPVDTGDSSQGPDVANADAIANDGLDHAAGTGVKEPKPGILKQTTTIDPKTGEQKHDLTVTDAFLQNVMSLSKIGQQAIAVYTANAQKAQQKQDWLDAHPGITAIGRLSSLAAAGYANPHRTDGALVRAAGVFGGDTFQDQTGNIAAANQGALQAQLGVTNALEKGAAYEQASSDRNDRLAEAKRKALTEERQKLASSAHDDVEKGSFSAQDYIANARALGVPDDQAMREAGGFVKAAEDLKALKQAEREAKTKEQKQLLHDQSEYKMKEIKYEAGVKFSLENMREARLKEGQSIKDTKVPPTVYGEVKSLNAAEKAIDRVEEIIKNPKFASMMGPVAGRTTGVLQAYLDPEVARAKTNLDLEVAQAIKATGAGARGFGPNERGFFQTLASGFKNSPEQNLGKVQAWRDFIRQNRQAIAESYKGVNEKPQEWVKGFGKDADVLGVVAAPSAAPAADAPEYDFKDGKLVPRAKK